jgi:hypothetical protein
MRSALRRAGRASCSEAHQRHGFACASTAARRARADGGTRGGGASSPDTDADAGTAPSLTQLRLQRRRLKAGLKAWRGVAFTGDAAQPFAAAAFAARGGVRAAKAAGPAVRRALDFRGQLAALSARFSRPAAQPAVADEAYANAWRAAASSAALTAEEAARLWRLWRRAAHGLPHESGQHRAGAAQQQPQQRRAAPPPAVTDARAQHCATLGLDAADASLSAADVRAALRRAALLHHPDRQAAGASAAAKLAAEAQFKRCTAAADALARLDGG